jgi:hypothetical protein
MFIPNRMGVRQSKCGVQRKKLACEPEWQDGPPLQMLAVVLKEQSDDQGFQSWDGSRFQAVSRKYSLKVASFIIEMDAPVSSVK